MIVLEQRRRWNPQVQGYLMQEAWISRPRSLRCQTSGSLRNCAPRRAHGRVEVAIFATAGTEQSCGY